MQTSADCYRVLRIFTKVTAILLARNPSHMRGYPMSNVLADEDDCQCDSNIFSNFGHLLRWLPFRRS
jgi:hypothetical protein